MLSRNITLSNNVKVHHQQCFSEDCESLSICEHLLLECIFNTLTLLSIACPNIYSYSGLISFWVAREMNGKHGSKKWRDRAIKCKDEFVKLSISASAWNFENSKCRHFYAVIFIFQYSASSFPLLISNLQYFVHRVISSSSRRALL